MKTSAAIFFCTYDTLKRVSPLDPNRAAVTHMVAASLAEVVRASLSTSSLVSSIHRTPFLALLADSQRRTLLFHGKRTMIMDDGIES